MKLQQIHIIGTGGGCSHIIHALLSVAQAQLGTPEIVLWDGDTFEPKNMARQFLAHGNDGEMKVEAFARYMQPLYRGKITAMPYWFTKASIDDLGDAIIICLADNHAARRACRDVADRFKVKMFSAANETNSGEAWIYDPDTKGTMNDPFVRYPDLETDMSGDPTRRGAGCMAEEVVRDNPQLPGGNLLSAAFVVWLITQNLTIKSVHNPSELRFVRNGLSATTKQQFAVMPQPDHLVEVAA